ncbi:acyl-CoA:lysophosphatidylglycerol acyltransferase 1-like [Tubulanus polymorphus]|uniref:acyl-CoA:lysophosphatidylglycerol acyltransferase 1-like n=1 Tax=Tubulanus polymorphus TaxID=672921 RepID=UPI003DA65023
MYTAIQILRFLFCVVNTLYSIPTYFLWLFLLLPLKFVKPTLFWTCETFMFTFLLESVASWQWQAGYDIVEFGGDEISLCEDDESIVIANHQSTADVPLLMKYFSSKPKVAKNLMWIMDVLFKYSNFGAVSMVRGDIFIRQGKECREQQLKLLDDCLNEDYWPRNRKWIVLFPEGGFLYKRLESSQRFAKKNNLPVLEHVTLPRVGALHVLLSNTNKQTGKRFKWLIDLTIAYPESNALDLMTIMSGSRLPCKTVLYTRCYAIDEISRDVEGLTSWMYDRYAEKDQLLDHYYKTGNISDSSISTKLSSKKLQYNGFSFILIHLFFLISSYFHYQWILFIFRCIF